MELLADLHCKILRKEDLRLTGSEIQELHSQIAQWEIVEFDSQNCLMRRFKFSNFLQALAFTNHIGTLAEEENHHPSITTEWGYVTVRWWTHTIQGLHKNDFIMAAKTDRLYSFPDIENKQEA